MAWSWENKGASPKGMKICKDGRVWGQNNKEAGNHLGILTGNKPHIPKDHTRSEAVRGKKNPMYGRSHSIETRRKIGEAERGAKHHNWKGGITSEATSIRGQVEYRLWREAVFARDNWTCWKCGKQGKRLIAHHIKSFKHYPELRFAINNGETLCGECHKLTDTYAGKGGKGIK